LTPSLMRWMLLMPLCAGVAGCPALLSDDFAISKDAGSSETSLTDDQSRGDAPTVDDAPPEAAICHSAVKYTNPPGCKSISETPEVANGAVAYAMGCQIVAAPVECSTCDYTCDCLLRYLELPDAGCACEQGLPSGSIIKLVCP
jgi:hypothetical protein